ncbi:MAG: hypothetical protein ACKVU4_11635 [Phycisphaerales bacterium]
MVDALNCRCGARRAFTLAETVAALVVLTIAIPPMLLALRERSSQRSAMELTVVARWLAAEKLEDVIADRHEPARGYTFVVSGSYPAESPVSGFAAFGRSVTVAETGVNLVSAGTGYKRATVEVTWTDPRAGARTFTLSTVLTEYTAP